MCWSDQLRARGPLSLVSSGNDRGCITPAELFVSAVGACVCVNIIEIFGCNSRERNVLDMKKETEKKIALKGV